MAQARPATVAAIRASLLAGALFLLTLLSFPRVGLAALYGLTVGINDYLGVQNDLDGAVNDANDIAGALRRAGAREVVVLLDRAATKDAIRKAWESLVAKAGAEDTIVFSYAGHGGQEPEPAGRNGEKDGLNENFLLAGYTPQGEGSRERIVDDEIFQWLKRADDKGIRVVFVADSCHSGSMHRSARAEGVKFRNGTFGPLLDDRLNLPPADMARLKEDDFSHVTFVGATSEDRRTPEVEIEGKKRGALSWAVARSLEGRADYNDDGDITQLELLGYVVPAVQSHVESQQTPQVVPVRARSMRLFTLASGQGSKREAPKEEQTLRIAVEGSAGATLKGLRSIEVVEDKRKADLIWYPDSGTVEHVVGGTVAEGISDKALRGVAVKWAALKWLKARAALDPVSVNLPNGNKRYMRGEIVRVTMGGSRYPYLTLFNLPPDGRVEFFIPDPRRKGEVDKDWRGEVMAESFRVSDPPFGAEHLVAIYSAEKLTDLHAALRSMKSAAHAAPLRAALEQYLDGKAFQVGILDIYTGSSN